MTVVALEVDRQFRTDVDHICVFKELSQRLTTSRALFDTEMLVSLIPRVVGRRTLGSV